MSSVERKQQKMKIGWLKKLAVAIRGDIQWVVIYCRMIRLMISNWCAMIPYHEPQNKILFDLFNSRRSIFEFYPLMIVAFLQVGSS